MGLLLSGGTFKVCIVRVNTYFCVGSALGGMERSSGMSGYLSMLVLVLGVFHHTEKILSVRRCVILGGFGMRAKGEKNIGPIPVRENFSVA